MEYISPAGTIKDPLVHYKPKPATSDSEDDNDSGASNITLLSLYSGTTERGGQAVTQATAIPDYREWILRSIFDLNYRLSDLKGRDSLFTAPERETRPAFVLLDQEMSSMEIAHVLHVLCAEQVRKIRATLPTSMTFRELWGKDVLDLADYFNSDAGAYAKLLQKGVREADLQQAIVWQLITGPESEKLLMRLTGSSSPDQKEGYSINEFKHAYYKRDGEFLSNGPGTRKFKLANIGGATAWPGNLPNEWENDKTIIYCNLHDPPHKLDDPSKTAAVRAAAPRGRVHVLKQGMLRRMFCDFVNVFQRYLEMRKKRPWYPQYLHFGLRGKRGSHQEAIERKKFELVNYGSFQKPFDLETKTRPIPVPDGWTRGSPWKSPFADFGEEYDRKYDDASMYWLQKDGNPWPVLSEDTIYEEYAWIDLTLNDGVLQYFGRKHRGFTFSEALFMYNSNEKVFLLPQVLPSSFSAWISARAELKSFFEKVGAGKPGMELMLEGLDQDRYRTRSGMKKLKVKPKPGQQPTYSFEPISIYRKVDTVRFRQDAGLISERFHKSTVVADRNVNIEKGGEIWHWKEYCISLHGAVEPKRLKTVMEQWNQNGLLNLYKGNNHVVNRYTIWVAGQDLYPSNRGNWEIGPLATRALYECWDPEEDPLAAAAAAAVALALASKCSISPDNAELAAAQTGYIQAAAAVTEATDQIQQEVKNGTTMSRDWSIVAKAVMAAELAAWATFKKAKARSK